MNKFQVGDRVKVINNRAKTYGCTGTIVKITENKSHASNNRHSYFVQFPFCVGNSEWTTNRFGEKSLEFVELGERVKAEQKPMIVGILYASSAYDPSFDDATVVEHFISDDVETLKQEAGKFIESNPGHEEDHWWFHIVNPPHRVQLSTNPTLTKIEA